MTKFGDTLSPGYYLIRIALWLLAALVLVQGVARIWPRKAQAS